MAYTQEVLPPPLDATSNPPPLFDGTTRNSGLYHGTTMRVYTFAKLGAKELPQLVLPVDTFAKVASVDQSQTWIGGPVAGIRDNLDLMHGSKSEIPNAPAVMTTAQAATESPQSSTKTGLQDQIKLVPINLQNRPAWYKEKVYPENKVPALEHNGKIIGESLDLIKYVDSNFEGPSLFPNDPEKAKFGEELISHVGTFTGALYTAFKADDTVKQADAQFDYLENALKKFEDGSFFLGQFSLADIAYIPFIERFQSFLSEVWKYDITAGRPKLAAWLEEINKIDAYKATKTDPKELVGYYKKRFLEQQ